MRKDRWHTIQKPLSEWLRMSVHERLKEVRLRRYSTAREAAEAMGVKYSTYAGHENTGRGIPRDALMRYAKFYNVSVDFLLTGRQNDAGERALIAIEGGELPVKGFVRASMFQESYEPEGRRTVPQGPDPRYKGRNQYALLIRGNSINKQAPDGHYAICVEHDGPVRNGDIVVVERRRAGLFEATIKVVRVTNGQIELWPDSDDPAYQEPINYRDGVNGDTDEVVIIAKVVAFTRFL